MPCPLRFVLAGLSAVLAVVLLFASSKPDAEQHGGEPCSEKQALAAKVRGAAAPSRGRSGARTQLYPVHLVPDVRLQR